MITSFAITILKKRNVLKALILFPFYRHLSCVSEPRVHEIRNTETHPFACFVHA